MKIDELSVEQINIAAGRMLEDRGRVLEFMEVEKVLAAPEALEFVLLAMQMAIDDAKISSVQASLVAGLLASMLCVGIELGLAVEEKVH